MDYFDDIFSFPNSPVQNPIDAPAPEPAAQNDSQNQDMQMVFNFFETDNDILGGRSNDFDSSVGGCAQTPNPHVFPSDVLPANAPKQVTRARPSVIALSPQPTQEMPKFPKSTDFVLEPEVFSVRSGKRGISRALPGISPQMDAFNALCFNQEAKINPSRLNFIPASYWPDQLFSFGDIVTSFFTLKNNPNARFPHKLYNALAIATHEPSYIPFVGLSWVNDYVMRVDTQAFAMLLGLKTVNGSLFHSQGNFPSHGFVELKSEAEALGHVSRTDLKGVDFENVRLLYHQARQFLRASTEQDLANLKWISVKSR